VRHAARDEYVVAGAYQKRWEMVVERGALVRGRLDAGGTDSRWHQGCDTGAVPAPWQPVVRVQLLLLAVNGLDELGDLVGGEDSQPGTRLEYLGVEVRYSRRMLTVESQELHRQPGALLRVDKVTDRETYMRRLRAFGLHRRAVEGRCDSSHMLVDLLHGTRQVHALGNYYRLRILSPRNIDQTVHHFPRPHWFDGQPLAEM